MEKEQNESTKLTRARDIDVGVEPTEIANLVNYKRFQEPSIFCQTKPHQFGIRSSRGQHV